MLSVFDQIQEQRATVDAVRRYNKKQQQVFTRSRKVDSKYGVALRKIARHVGEIIKAFPVGDPSVIPELNRTLRAYAATLEPWAHHMAGKILREVAHWDEIAFRKHSQQMSNSIKAELANSNVGHVFRQLQDDQVKLITSIPLEAAERVHELTQKSLSDSSRASAYIEEIMKSGHVAQSRATLIARTEIGRAATSFTQARATQLGSTHYRWRTAHDNRVRTSHKKMEGKIIAWSDPPTLDNLTGHAGQIPNCRCYPEVIFNDED